MAAWTVFGMPVQCGACGELVPAGEPVQLVTSRQLRRCAEHAFGPVNWQEVDLERARLEMEQARERTPAAVEARPRGGSAMRSYASIADTLPFDPRAAAAGDRE